MSGTPRTDAIDHGLSSWHGGVINGAFAVMTEHARQLERELMAARQTIDYWHQLAEHLGGLTKARDKCPECNPRYTT